MNAKEKAKTLIYEMYKCMPVKDGKIGTDEKVTLVSEMEMLSAKQCALISVDEIIQAAPHEFWIEVKSEINNFSEQSTPTPSPISPDTRAMIALEIWKIIKDDGDGFEDAIHDADLFIAELNKTLTNKTN